MDNNRDRIVDLLAAHHKRIEAILSQLDATPPSDLQDYFCQLREELVRHEVAEEVVVYPVLRERADNGNEVADACIAEQSEAERALAAMESVQQDPDALRPRLEHLRSAVLAHAKHEERDVFALLTASVDENELVEMGRRYERALVAAPTHPHPHAPDSPPGNKILGPIAALADHLRDAMSRAA